MTTALAIIVTQEAAVGLGLILLGLALTVMTIYLGRQLLPGKDSPPQAPLPINCSDLVKRMMNLVLCAVLLINVGALQLGVSRETAIGDLLLFVGLVLIIMAAYLLRQLLPPKASVQPALQPANSSDIVKRMLTRLTGAALLILAGTIQLGVTRVR